MRTLPGLTLTLVLVLVLLTACTTMPESIDDPAAREQPDVATARESPEQFRGQTVRWGGTIAGVENRADATLLEVVARELDSRGRPLGDDASGGRFLAVVPEFLDPAIHKPGRSVTVVGELDGVANRKVGEFDYPYPRIRVTGLQLWQPQPRHWQPYPPGYFHDPFYGFRGPFYRPAFPHPDDPLLRHYYPY